MSGIRNSASLMACLVVQCVCRTTPPVLGLGKLTVLWRVWLFSVCAGPHHMSGIRNSDSLMMCTGVPSISRATSFVMQQGSYSQCEISTTQRKCTWEYDV